MSDSVSMVTIPLCSGLTVMDPDKSGENGIHVSTFIQWQSLYIWQSLYGMMMGYPPQVAYIGEDIERIPDHLVSKFSKTAKRLDLSYNRIR